MVAAPLLILFLTAGLKSSELGSTAFSLQTSRKFASFGLLDFTAAMTLALLLKEVREDAFPKNAKVCLVTRIYLLCWN